jgi:hypothetical protein
VNRFISQRRVLPLAVLALLVFAWSATSALAEDCRPFRVSGTFEVVSAQVPHIEVAVTGHANVGGRFTGLATGKQFNDGDVRTSVTLDFGGGDTLTYFQVLEVTDDGDLIVGTYEITGGTGRFAGASGSGDNVIDPFGDGTGTFELDGTICK